MKATLKSSDLIIQGSYINVIFGNWKNSLNEQLYINRKLKTIMPNQGFPGPPSTF